MNLVLNNNNNNNNNMVLNGHHKRADKADSDPVNGL